MSESTGLEPYCTTAEIAAYLAKPVSWVLDNADHLGIPRYRLGKQYRYLLSEVEAWMGEQRD